VLCPKIKIQERQNKRAVKVCPTQQNGRIASPPSESNLFNFSFLHYLAPSAFTT
jgi:hypothetical protein